MEPTLEAHEYLVIDQLTYRFNKPARGDVVIFRYPMDPSVFFIKRVIGLPGETVEMHNGLVTITSKDALHRVVLAEPYASETVRGESAAITLEDDEYFVLGDNREESSDSRTWGPLHERYIVGRALVRLFPFTDMSMFPGKYVFSNEGFE